MNDISLVVVDGNLELSAYRKKLHEERVDLSHSIERASGDLKRTITLPKNAVEDSISANLDNGVLVISIDKKVPNTKVKL